MKKYLALTLVSILMLGTIAQALVIPASTVTLKDGQILELAEIDTTGWTTPSLYGKNLRTFHNNNNYRVAWNKERKLIFPTVYKQLLDEYMTLDYQIADYVQLSHMLRWTSSTLGETIPHSTLETLASKYLAAVKDNPAIINYACACADLLKQQGYHAEYLDMVDQLLAVVPLDNAPHGYFYYGIATNTEIVTTSEAKTAIANALTNDNNRIELLFLNREGYLRANQPYVEYTVENVVNAISPWTSTKNNDKVVIGAIACFDSLPWITMTVQEGIDACNRMLMVMPVNETTAPFLSTVKDKKRILSELQ